MKTKFNYRIEQDTDAENPRTSFDNVGTMVCWHRRYNLGDEQPNKDAEEWLFDFAGYSEEWLYNNTPTMAQALKRIKRDHVILPLYLYDHSGITMNTTGFSCGWDSGQAGFIYVHRDNAIKEWGLKPNNWRKKAEKYLTGEVETYDQYLTGDVYGYVVFEEDEDGEIVEDHLDSCWGFYGEKDAEDEAKGMVEHFEKERIEQAEKEERENVLCEMIMHV